MDVVLGLDYYLDYFLRYCIYVHCDLCEVGLPVWYFSENNWRCGFEPAKKVLVTTWAYCPIPSPSDTPALES